MLEPNPPGLDALLRQEGFQLSDREVVGASVASHRRFLPGLACKEDAGADYTQPPPVASQVFAPVWVGRASIVRLRPRPLQGSAATERQGPNAIITKMDQLTMASSDRVAAAYAAAQESRLIVEHEPPGLLRLRGANALDFLHRMSTNDLTRLEPGGTTGTVLTTAIGRTVDVVQVMRRPSDVLMLTTSGRQTAVQAWLRRYIFFNDDVQVEGMDETFRLWGIYGPTSAAAVGELVGSVPEGTGHFLETGDGLVWGTTFPVEGVRLLAGTETDSRARRRWRDDFGGAGRSPGLRSSPHRSAATRPSGARSTRTSSHWKSACGIWSAFPRAAISGKKSLPAWKAAAASPADSSELILPSTSRRPRKSNWIDNPSDD